MITGTLVSESLRVGAEISGVSGRRLVGVRRVQVASASPDQASRWTLIDFEAPDVRAGGLAEACAATLDQPGWSVDLHTAKERYVVFSGRVFRYPRGDASGRAEAEAYALGLGVPAAQVDWPER